MKYKARFNIWQKFIVWIFDFNWIDWFDNFWYMEFQKLNYEIKTKYFKDSMAEDYLRNKYNEVIIPNPKVFRLMHDDDIPSSEDEPLYIIKKIKE